MEEPLGPIIVSGSWRRQGELLRRLDRVEEAITCYKHALDLDRVTYATSPSSLVSSLRFLSWLYMDSEDSWDLGESLFQEIVDMKEGTVGKTREKTKLCLDYANILDEMAQIHAKKGNNQEALDFYLKAFALRSEKEDTGTHSSVYAEMVERCLILGFPAQALDIQARLTLEIHQ